MKKNKVNIFWFRRDLRLEDNTALYHALNAEYPVIPVFIFDKNILKGLDDEDARVTFIHDSLSKIREKLKTHQKDIHTYFDTPLDAWKEILKSYDIDCVYSNEDYEPYGISRDEKVSKLLNKNNVEFIQHKDHCIFSKNDVLKKDGKPYTVYTPYKNKWLETLTPEDFKSFSSEKMIQHFLTTTQKKFHSLEDIGFTPSKIKIPKRVIRKKILNDYHNTRDIPSVDGTSLLGIHLRFGTVSVRKLASIAFHTNKVWLSELIWREFFSQILYHFPHVQNAPFREKYEGIEWRNNKKEFKLWCEGRTGFPLVDAGMRELNATGHMHNRVRMVVASFLIKDLLIDWRWGEKYFASKLLDFELASNNGNWQWAAGTGCDAAPYFRIFNPETQLKKFDSDFKYVKKWVPEYGTQEYCSEIVDHKEAYHRAIFTYNRAVK